MKRTLALVLAICMSLFVFAGCGSTSGTEVGDNTIVIGGIGPLTGSAAIYGNAVKNGMQLAVDEINAAGGVNGIKFALNFQDDENDAEKAVNAYNTLMDAGLKVLAGTVTSDPCVAVAAKSAEDNVFQITPSGSSVQCTTYDNAYRVCFNDPNQGLAAAQYIKENNLASKVAVIYNSSDVYSSGIYEKFASEASKDGLEITTAQAFTKDNATDFSVQLQKIKESGAELVFLPIYYQEAALILTQADKAGFDFKWFGCDGLDGLTDQLGEANVAMAEDVMLLTPFAADATDEASVKFVSAYKAKFNNETPIQFAADGYDAIYAIKTAMEKAEIKDSSVSASELCEALKKVMTEIEVAGVTGHMTWDESGEPTKEPKAMVIKNGEYKAM